MKKFTIKNEDSSITIETRSTRYEAIESLILNLFRYYRDKKPEELNKLVRLINVAYENFVDTEELIKFRLQRDQIKKDCTVHTVLTNNSSKQE